MVIYPLAVNDGVITAICLSIIHSTSAVVNTALLYSIIKEKSTRKRKIDQANLILIAFNFVWTITCATCTIISVSNGGYDQLTCNIYGFAVGVCASGGLFAQGAMALERYTVIVLEDTISTKKLLCVILFPFLSAIAICSIQLTNKMQFVGLDGNSWCFVPFYDIDPPQLVISILIVVEITTVAVLILYVYFAIYRKVVLIKKEVESIFAWKTPPKGKSAFHEADVLRRCLLVSLTFISCYCVEFMIFLYQIVAQTTVDKTFGQVAAVIAVFSTFVNPLIAISTNRAYQKAMKCHIFGIVEDEVKSRSVKGTSQ